MLNSRCFANAEYFENGKLKHKCILLSKPYDSCDDCKFFKSSYEYIIGLKAYYELLNKKTIKKTTKTSGERN